MGRRKKKAEKKKVEIPVPKSESNLTMKCNYGDLIAVKQLLSDSPELLDKKGMNGCTPLIRAVRSEEEHSEAVVEYLLDAGADIEAEAYGGMRALHFSAANSRLGIMDKLLLKADVHSVDASKNTALHWACRRPAVNPIKRLLDKGAKLEAKNSAGITALHLACSAGVIPTTKCLIEAGADPNVPTGDGLNSLHIAIDGGHVKLALWLLDNVPAVDSDKATRSGDSCLDLAVRGHLDVVVERLQAPPAVEE
jgi:ankyrin repeat protein|tara:strand:+ start:20 stop:772 length:753 start_codon:yes stop_codon:yes gene_type:complete